MTVTCGSHARSRDGPQAESYAKSHARSHDGPQAKSHAESRGGSHDVHKPSHMPPGHAAFRKAAM
jgi:hypothetical protein